MIMRGVSEAGKPPLGLSVLASHGNRHSVRPKVATVRPFNAFGRVTGRYTGTKD